MILIEGTKDKNYIHPCDHSLQLVPFPQLINKSICFILLTDVSFDLPLMWLNHCFLSTYFFIKAILTWKRISPFITLSLLILSYIHFNIHNSTILIFYIYCFLLAKHFVPYNRVSLTTILKSFLLNLKAYYDHIKLLSNSST